jgi:hypothetical protein
VPRTPPSNSPLQRTRRKRRAAELDRYAAFDAAWIRWPMAAVDQERSALRSVKYHRKRATLPYSTMASHGGDDLVCARSRRIFGF